MSIAFICVTISAFLIYISKAPVAYFMQKAGGYDNHYPRQQQAQLTGAGQRALAAHQNSFEALLIFAVAVCIASISQVEQNFVDQCALIVIAARIAYHICYLADWATLRSLVWFVGITASFTIMTSPAWHSV